MYDTTLILPVIVELLFQLVVDVSSPVGSQDQVFQHTVVVVDNVFCKCES